MSGFSESEGDNADAIDQVDGQAQIDGDQEAVIQDRTESGDGGSAECTVKVDPQTSTWTKSRWTPEARKMADENGTRRPLFGGAVSTAFPVRFQDVSNIREVPDRQEVLIDPTRDESLIFELIDLKGEVEDGDSALWFLRDVANEQDAGITWLFQKGGKAEKHITLFE
ncbi:putative ran guanine nucleotide release factor [Hordeum vulgare]|nr:putative ran guanine nucleotide release factor [Hordeum vulgare]